MDRERIVFIIIVSVLVVAGSYHFSWNKKENGPNTENSFILSNLPLDRKDVYIKAQKQIDQIQVPCNKCKSCPVFTNCYGLPNLASMYLGSSIASIKDTKPFVPSNSKCGSSGCTNDVNTIIQPELLKPGKNWRFGGQNGRVVIELGVISYLTGITLIHPTKSQIPEGFFISAPKEFHVFGLENPKEVASNLLGSFMYKDDGYSAQTFEIKAQLSQCNNKKTGMEFKFVEVHIQNNYGSPEYTSLYKIEIHGVPIPLSVIQENPNKVSGSKANCNAEDPQILL